MRPPNSGTSTTFRKRFSITRALNARSTMVVLSSDSLTKAFSAVVAYLTVLQLIACSLSVTLSGSAAWAVA